MSKVHQPVFVKTPRHPKVRTTGIANGVRTGTGTMYQLFTAGARGSYFRGFAYTAIGTVSSTTMLRFYIRKSGTTTIELKKEMLVLSGTPGTSQECESGHWFPTAGLVLEPGDTVFVSCSSTALFSCWLVDGGDY